LGKAGKRIEFENLINRAALVLAVVTLFLAATFLPPATNAKDNPDDYTRTYSHTFDEVFQAAPTAIERQGYFVTGKDKEKGTITASGVVPNPTGVSHKVDFTLRIETVGTEETRVTVDPDIHGFGGSSFRKRFVSNMFIELQKVLATYR